MRIVIIAAGSRGDVQPPAGLAAALAARGHAVRLVAPPDFAGLAAPGVEFHALPLDIQGELQRGRAVFDAGANPIAFMRLFLGIARRRARDMIEVCRDAADGCDVVVGTGLADYAAVCVAEYWKTPCVHGFLQPILASRDWPSVMAPAPPFRLPGWLNRAQHKAIAQATWLPVRMIGNSVVRKTLGLPPSPLSPPIEAEAARGEPIAMAYSRHLAPRGSDWPANVDVTGYWFLDAPHDWTPPEALVRFLDAGAPPVYVGFGSMVMKDAAATLTAVVDAVTRLGRRAVVSAGWGGLHADDLPPHICAIEAAPHDWLFPRMAAIVHHGGAGTTGAALRAGKPSVVTPFLLDQFFWGARLAAIGVAPPPIPHRRLTAAKLRRALDQVLGDEAMQSRAATIGELVRAEGGIERTIAMIEAAGRGMR